MGSQPSGGAPVRPPRAGAYRTLPWPPGAATRWQNGLGLTSFVVELPPGALCPAAARRHAEAVLGLAE